MAPQPHRRKIMQRQTEGTLQKIRGKIRSTWGDITDDDIDRVKGNMDELVGTIKQKTGESEEKIRDRLRDMDRDEAGH
jgi:uncharacterized protein YjbJ (UPF0337 family)